MTRLLKLNIMVVLTTAVLLTACVVVFAGNSGSGSNGGPKPHPAQTVEGQSKLDNTKIQPLMPSSGTEEAKRKFKPAEKDAREDKKIAR